MIEKRFRMSLDFKVVINEITRESVEHDLELYSNYDEIIERPETWEDAERQKRLLHAVLKNKDVLSKFLAYIIVDEVEPTVGGKLHDILGVEGDTQEIVQPVFDKLSEDDATFFKEVISEGLFPENSMHFSESFQVELEEAGLDEL